MFISTEYHWKAFLSFEADQFFSPWLKASIADLLKFQALSSKARRPNCQIEMEVENQNKNKDWSKVKSKNNIFEHFEAEAVD